MGRGTCRILCSWGTSVHFNPNRQGELHLCNTALTRAALLGTVRKLGTFGKVSTKAGCKLLLTLALQGG